MRPAAVLLSAPLRQEASQHGDQKNRFHYQETSQGGIKKVDNEPRPRRRILDNITVSLHTHNLRQGSVVSGHFIWLVQRYQMSPVVTGGTARSPGDGTKREIRMCLHGWLQSREAAALKSH